MAHKVMRCLTQHNTTQHKKMLHVPLVTTHYTPLAYRFLLYFSSSKKVSL